MFFKKAEENLIISTIPFQMIEVWKQLKNKKNKYFHIFIQYLHLQYLL